MNFITFQYRNVGSPIKLLVCLIALQSQRLSDFSCITSIVINRICIRDVQQNGLDPMGDVLGPGLANLSALSYSRVPQNTVQSDQVVYSLQILLSITIPSLEVFKGFINAMLAERLSFRKSYFHFRGLSAKLYTHRLAQQTTQHGRQCGRRREKLRC